MMMDQTKWEQCRHADLISCKNNELVDLRDINIDTSRPVPERMAAFLNQVGNPYLFKAEGLIIKTVYLPDADRRFCDAVSVLLDGV